MEEAAKDWANAAIAASNLSETELLLGDIAAAVATAQKVGRTRGSRRRSTFGCWRFERTRPTRSTPPASGKRPRICSPTPSAGSESCNRNIPCCIRCKGIGTATSCCRGGRPSRRAIGPRRPCNGAKTHNLASRRRARYSDPRPRPSRPGAAELGKATFGRKPLAMTREPLLSGSMRAVEGLRASGDERTISLAAFSPAPHSAARSAIGMAPNATWMKQKRSPNRD